MLLHNYPRSLRVLSNLCLRMQLYEGENAPIGKLNEDT